MKCSNIRPLTSAYIDEVLDDPERSLVETHLAACPDCAEYLRSMDAARLQMRSLSMPEFPAALASRILWEQKWLNSSPPLSRISGIAIMRRFLDVHPYRPGAIASVASFFITCTMYAFLLGHLKPIPNWTVPGRFEQFALTSKQFSDLNERSTESRRGGYTLPRVVSTARLEESLRDAPDSAIVLVTLINVDGRASVVEILTPRNRPDVAAQVSGALRDISFKPATTAGRPVATQLVLMLEKIDVRG